MGSKIWSHTPNPLEMTLLLGVANYLLRLSFANSLRDLDEEEETGGGLNSGHVCPTIIKAGSWWT